MEIETNNLISAPAEDDIRNNADNQPLISQITEPTELVTPDQKSLPIVDKRKKAGRPGGITRQAQCFLELLASGKKTQEAYELAGYKGEMTAAYQLRFKLKKELRTILRAQGLSKDGVLIELKKILEVPMHTQSVSFGERLKLLKFLATLDPEQEKEDKPQITPFIIQNVDRIEVVSSLKEGEITAI
jgi:hypothetical protein